MIIPMLCVTIFVILVVWFLLPRVARLMIHTPTAISIFVCLSMVQLMAVFISMRCTLCGHFLQVFFFQAEDGIRDYKVTGVQTCALPILLPLLGSSRLRMPARQLTHIAQMGRFSTIQQFRGSGKRVTLVLCPMVTIVGSRKQDRKSVV